MKIRNHKRLFTLLLVLALVVGIIPSALADNAPDISAAESTKESLVGSQSKEEPIISPPIQSILELDEAADDSEMEAAYEAPTSMDGETLTRMDNDGLMLLGGGGTMGKSTCVTFAAYQSAHWKCHRYEVDGSHSYGHYFYTSEIAYHTIDGVDSYCIEPNTTSLGGQYYTSYTADEASSSSYWKLELDNLQRSHIQKILTFGYPQVDYGYSRQVQYAATQVLIWEVVSHSRYNADIKSCTDYGLYRNVYAVLGADFQSCYDGILNAISVSDGTVPSFSGSSQSNAKSITLTLNNSTGCYEGSVRDTAGVLSHFTFSASGVNFSRSGNTLYISVPAANADAIKGQPITGTSDQKLMSTSNPTIWENPTYQTVLTSGGADYLHAYISLTWEDAPKAGSLVVSKAVNYGSWSGFTFRLHGTSDKGNSVDVTATTGSDGKAYFKDIEIGTYTLEEVSPGSAYLLPEPQTVTIPGDDIAYATAENVWKHWRATITKVDADTGKTSPQGDATLNGAEYTLYKSGKFNELTTTMFDAIYAVGDEDAATITDASTIDVELITLGKAHKSENHGEVSGDLNVGGVAGSMSEESEIDPEDDVSADISAKYKQEYTLKAVIHNCTNDGTITAKRDYVGCICGKMDLGLITNAKGFGEASSESGSYVGGIAGLTGATIRNSYAKCTLSGKKYIGGIVGSGIEETINQSVSNVSGCYSMVDVSSAQQYFGAVSGANAGEYLENYFVSDTLEGIDGQSYSGKAEPISYETLRKVTGLPKEMKALTLRFTAGEETLKELTFDYGDSFGKSDYPEIPEKDGCYSYWDKTDLTVLHFDTVVAAVYEPYVTTLAAENQREDNKPIFYIEGDYDGTEQPMASAQQKSTAGFAPISDGVGKAVKHYLKGNAWYTWLVTPMNRELVEQWSINIPDDGQDSHKVHYLSPDETTDHLQIFVRQDGDWTKLDSEDFGSYLVFSLPDGENEIAIVSVLYVWWAWAILLVLVAALVTCIVLLCRKHAKKRKAKKIQAAATVEGEENAPQHKKKKRRIVPLVIGLIVLAVIVVAALYFINGFGSQISAYQALTSMEEQKELSAELTIDTELDGEVLHSQTKLERKTIDGVRFSQIALEGCLLYTSDAADE